MALASAYKIVAAAWLAGIAPDPDLKVSEWAGAHRIVAAETSSHPGLWDNSFMPFLVEPMDCLSPSHWCETVTFKKSSQVGGTEVGTNWLGYIIYNALGPSLVIHPTVDAAKGWVSEKLDPTIEETKPLKDRIKVQTSRSSRGSTSLLKRFPGGWLRMSGANSAAALRQKSVRNMIKDDWSEWPDDLDGQGDPDKMADARMIAYTASGQNKALQISTPTIKGRCRTTAAYEKSDHRHYYVKCPQCGHDQKLQFFPDKSDPFTGGLRFNREWPHQAHYVCGSGNGCVIEHHEKAALIQPENGARWIAENAGPGRQPGFHINALYSRVTTWDKIASEFLAAKDDPAKLKTFYNLWLGLEWEVRGDAPEWENLLKRRGGYRLGHIPPGGLILTGFVDVQKDGLYYEIVAWGEGKTTWVVDASFIAGETADTTSECWKELTKIRERKYPDAYGNEWHVDIFGVDSGFNTNQVYDWVRKAGPNVIACKGVGGWQEPALGAAKKIEVKKTGDRRKKGMRVWTIGTWSLKGELYANLRKEPPLPGAEMFPSGYCHFAEDLPETYFKQLTAEYLDETKTRSGITIHQWKSIGENHFHDCRVGNMALTEHPKLLLSRWTARKWAEVAAVRAVIPEQDQSDLENLWNPPVGTPGAKPKTDAATAVAAPKPVRQPKRGGGFVGKFKT